MGSEMCIRDRVRDKWYGVNSKSSGGSILDFGGLDVFEGISILDWMK